MATSEDVNTPVPARPGWWLALVATTQLGISGLLAAVLATEDLHEGGVVVFWATSWLPVLVIGAVAGLACSVRSHRITSRAPARVGWLGFGVTTLTLAHWAPMLAWSPVAFLFSVIDNGHRDDHYLSSAVAGLLAWLVVAGAAVLAIRARDRLEPGAVRPYRAGPGLLAEWLVAAAYAVPVAILTAAAIAGGGDGRGYAWTALPALLGVGALLATPAAWTGAAADMTAARFGGTRGDWRWSFVGRIGALLALLAAPLFVMTLFPVWERGLGQRFGIQTTAIVLLALATWSVARWRLPVGRTPAPG